MYSKPAPPARYAQPDYALIHQELKHKGVTLQLLWEEYEKAHGQSACRYSQFCLHYHEYRGKLARSMRQVHRAGEKVFIDYSGDTVAVIDAKSSEILTAEIFVATLGASKYAYAEATWTQTLPDWIGSTIRMLEFFGRSRACGSQITSKRRSKRPAVMSRRPPRRTRTARATMAQPSYRRVPITPRIKPPSR